MKITASLKAGFARSLKTWRGVLIVWFVSLILVSLVTIPMKGSLIAGFVNSMITEKLAKGINIEVFADLGSYFRSLVSYFPGGLLIATIAGILINSFFCGGLFNFLKGSQTDYSAPEFFRASVKFFRPFLIISILIILIILFSVILIIVIPLVIVSQSEILPEGAVLTTAIIVVSFFLLVLTMILLIADFSRAWLVSEGGKSAFKALRFGMRHAFGTFFKSYGLMMILMIIQVIYGAFALHILAGFKPVTGSGIILLFLLSQLLFFIKIFLKAARYGCVTRMMELN